MGTFSTSRLPALWCFKKHVPYPCLLLLLAVVFTMASSSNETVHISLGNTANHITSHLLNLQGLAATDAGVGSHSNRSDGDDQAHHQSLCDPSVTHDIASIESDYYASYAGSPSASGRYMYVPRTLIVDGRDSFGAAWGGVSRNSNVGGSAQISSWGGSVSVWDSNTSPDISSDQHRNEQQNVTAQSQQQQENKEDDPLDNFRNAASMMGLSPLYSRFVAVAPSHSYNYSVDNSRHVQWDEEEDEDNDDDYCYGQDIERRNEEKRRQMERMELNNKELKNNWNSCMEESWQQAFYSNEKEVQADDAMTTPSAATDVSNDASSSNKTSARTEREIHWYDYWMPPRPLPHKYQIQLPFDTASSNSNRLDSQGNNVWSTSFSMGYHPASGGGTDGSIGITQSWREHAMSEALRKVLEGCDVVKGFNVFVDGGSFCEESGASASGELNKHAKQLSNIITGGGGFYAGMATSLLEELQEECRSAGRWAVLADPLSYGRGDASLEDTTTEISQIHHFRRRLNAGLALHGLSTNADSFLPVSVDGAHRALRGDSASETPVSQNRILFEGCAALSLCLETSTLFYRLRRNAHRSKSPEARSRIGIQSGFYQGFGGNTDYQDDNDSYASAPALTYHEFLACTKSSSDKRRSILELDALLRPLSYPSGGNALGGGIGGGLEVSALESLLKSSGLSVDIGGTRNGYRGELHQRMMRGTSLEQMRLEQDRQSRSRGYSSSRRIEPGEWLEDIATNSGGGGGLLASLSGNTNPFGRRSVHHHFALSTGLRPAASDGECVTTSYLRPIMESLGVRYRPEVSVGVVAKDTVVDLTGVGSYWSTVFTGGVPVAGSPPHQKQQKEKSSREVAAHTPILSVLGNSTRSYPRLSTISSGFVDALNSRRNMGYMTRDVMAGLIPEKDDCEDALEYCRELVDVYEPPMGSGLVWGEDENDDMEAYFDEN